MYTFKNSFGSKLVQLELLNLKRHGLFSQLNTGGGGFQSIWEKHSVTPPNFILEQQTLSNSES
jgi:hypothetical protein